MKTPRTIENEQQLVAKLAQGVIDSVQAAQDYGSADRAWKVVATRKSPQEFSPGQYDSLLANVFDQMRTIRNIQAQMTQGQLHTAAAFIEDWVVGAAPLHEFLSLTSELMPLEKVGGEPFKVMFRDPHMAVNALIRGLSGVKFRLNASKNGVVPHHTLDSTVWHVYIGDNPKGCHEQLGFGARHSDKYGYQAFECCMSLSQAKGLAKTMRECIAIAQGGLKTQVLIERARESLRLGDVMRYYRESTGRVNIGGTPMEGLAFYRSMLQEMSDGEVTWQQRLFDPEDELLERFRTASFSDVKIAAFKVDVQNPALRFIQSERVFRVPETAIMSVQPVARDRRY